jgi:hypothetical protein
MYDASKYQENLKQYTEKYSQLNTQLWELNSQFLDGYLKRQSNFVTDLTEAGTDYFKELSQGDFYSNYQKVDNSFGEDLKNRYIELNQENMTAYQAHQERLEGLYQSLFEEDSTPKPAKKAKSKAKAAA